MLEGFRAFCYIVYGLRSLMLQLIQIKVPICFILLFSGVYNDFNLSFNQLLSKGNHVMVHQKNLKTLCLKRFKAINGLSPKFINAMFTEKVLNCNLRICNLLTLPKTSTITYGIHSFTYRATSTWNNISDDIKDSVSVFVCKQKLKKVAIKCSCKLCFKP